jgi:GntR family transcriptional repressor for pyruvate dehydrogenase complex
MGLKRTEKNIEPVSKDLLHVRVASAICRLIRSENLRVGDKLPSERTLAERLNAGRNTVREALSLLRADGVVEIAAGKGAFVMKEQLELPLQMELLRVDYRDLLEIKMWLESLAIRRAAECATEAQLERLIELGKQLNELAETGNFSIALDREFHTQLLACGGSSTLAQLVLSLVDALNDYSGVFDGAVSLWLKTVPHHLELASALKEKNLNFALAAHEYIRMYDLRVLDEPSGKP